MPKWLVWLSGPPVIYVSVLSILLNDLTVFEVEDPTSFDLFCISFVRVVFIGCVLIYFHWALWRRLTFYWPGLGEQMMIITSEIADMFHERKQDKLGPPPRRKGWVKSGL